MTTAPRAASTATEAAASFSVPAPSSNNSSGAVDSIISAGGISPLAKLLFVTAKLFSRNLISKEERRILKQLAIRVSERGGLELGDPSVRSIDLSGPDFLTQLIDIASSIAISAASHTFHHFLYRHCTTSQGKSLSKGERRAKDIKDNSFVYGEIDFISFSQIIKEIRPLLAPNGVFFDLGSGTGRPCFAMALLSDFQRIVGVEALESLVQASRAVLEQYETFVESDEVEVEVDDDNDNDETPASAAPADAATASSPSRPGRKKIVVHSPLVKLERRAASAGVSVPARVEFVCADFLAVDWSSADLVFINSTCYSPSLMSSLSARAELLKPGAIVVSLTKSLTPSPNFTISSKRKYQMSWGAATAYVQRRN